MAIIQNRRGFLTGVAAAAALNYLRPRAAFADDAALETTSVRLASAPGICVAPQYVAEELLRFEGFTDITYVAVEAGLSATAQTARGDIDLQIEFATAFVLTIDRGAPIKVLSGVHVGCYELFASKDIHSVVDLKGKNVGVGYNLGSDPHVFVSAMATYVGLDPTVDINWVTSSEEPLELFKQSKIDAFLSFPPEAQKLRAEGVGHVIVNSMQDDPWSQYFCCMLAGNADYVSSNPVATKRAVRAILKSADICISEPERAARLLVDKGYAPEYDFALQALKEIPFAPWRDFDPEDTIRFFALRLHESGQIKSNPQRIIADGTDWTMLNEIRRELKA
jgi:NitT/TauT family transport system substrate-binding protein